MKRQTGFTLIELITVIVILGVLAVVALPRYIDLQDNAQDAALQGVKGGAEAAHAVNLAAALASDANTQQVDSCTDTGALLQSGAAPDGYTFNDVGTPAGPEGSAIDCSVVQDATGNSAAFTGYWVD